MRWHRKKWQLPVFQNEREKPVKQVIVDQERCRGCFLCTRIAPDVFRLDKNGKATVISEVDDKNRKAVTKAVCCCPACAIREI